MTDPWLEGIYQREYNANAREFFNKVKTLFTQERQREKKIVSLLKRYENADISVGKIAENLNLDREEVLALMSKYNVALVDYNWADEDKNIENFLTSY
jgi:predicted HTH domain antitoxin